MASTQLGLEIDGDHVTLVEVSGGLAVASRTVTHPELSTAISLALQGYQQNKIEGSIRVVLAAPGINLRRIDVTSAMLSRAGFEDVVFTALPVPRETNSASGVFFQPDEISGDIVTPGIALIAASSQVDKTYQAFGRRSSEVVAPPTIFSGLDGIWLGMRHRTADVTLVSNGRPIAYRQLRCGGLDSVAAALGDGKQGQSRLMAALYQSGAADPIADAELTRYLSSLSLEIRQTCDFWVRSNESVPSLINAYGAGAGSSGLFRALSEQGFETGMHPEVEKRLIYLPAADRPAAVAGFLAAVTSGLDMPQVAFVNPYAIKFAEENSRRDRRARRLLTGAIGIGIVSLIGGIPYVSSQLALREARADLTSAQEQFASAAPGYNKLQDTKIRVAAAEQIRSGQPDWSESLSITFATMPNNAELRDLTASLVNSNLQIAVTVELPNGKYEDLTRWLDKLRATPNVSAAWSESFSDRDSGAVFEVSFTILRETPIQSEDLSPDSVKIDTEQAPKLPADNIEEIVVPVTPENVTSTEVKK